MGEVRLLPVASPSGDMNAAMRTRRRLLLRLARFLPYSELRVDGVVGPLHGKDPMFERRHPLGGQIYAQVGRSAMEAIGRALGAAGRDWDSVRRVLDFGCGYGRVLRLLRQRLTGAAISASDLDPRAVWFCARRFGARPLLSSPDIESIELGRYDLVWVGSVFTHLRREDGETLFRRLAGSLEPSGVLVCSFHGSYSLDNLDQLYDGLYARDADDIRREVESVGFGYRTYPDTYQSYEPGRYGMAWHALSFFDRLAESLDGELSRVAHVERGWDGHQDVVAFQRRGETVP